MATFTYTTDDPDEFATILASIQGGESAPAPAKAAKASKKAAPAPVEEEEAEETEEGTHDRKSLTALSRDDLKAVADEYEVEYTPKTRTATLIDLVLEALDGGEEDEEETPDEEESEDEEEAEEEEEESDDEESEYWTKAELDKKTLGELKSIAKDYDVDPKGLGKPALIKAILA